MSHSVADEHHIDPTSNYPTHVLEGEDAVHYAPWFSPPPQYFTFTLDLAASTKITVFCIMHSDCGVNWGLTEEDALQKNWG
ncbi:hypothetical protein PIB30_023251 [Stylosanthes scabra]|uniref:Uncharacterized protein n=1 Tax=Stylosanthes scabra TaxID=79078 RepID=A0ABU6Y7S2_9FABA|nr:hypothetical protein [Stylosanthes scabra]